MLENLGQGETRVNPEAGVEKQNKIEWQVLNKMNQFFEILENMIPIETVTKTENNNDHYITDIVYTFNTISINNTRPKICLKIRQVHNTTNPNNITLEHQITSFSYVDGLKVFNLQINQNSSSVNFSLTEGSYEVIIKPDGTLNTSIEITDPLLVQKKLNKFLSELVVYLSRSVTIE